MSASDPNQHQAAPGVEFFYSLLHRSRDHVFAKRAMSPLQLWKPCDSTYCMVFGSYDGLQFFLLLKRRTRADSTTTKGSSDSLATIRFPRARRQTFESPDQRSRPVRF
jgi:hypothetical protein